MTVIDEANAEMYVKRYKWPKEVYISGSYEHPVKYILLDTNSPISK